MSSTCYNVFLYAWLNDNFRKELKRVLPCFSDAATAPGVAQQQAAATHHGAAPTGAAVTGTTLATANNAPSACDLRKRSINGLSTIMDDNPPMLHIANEKNLTPDVQVIRLPQTIDFILDVVLLK